MDEGLTQFNAAQGVAASEGFANAEESSRRNYVEVARAGLERPLMTHSDSFPSGSPAYGIAAYEKPAALMSAIRLALGDSVFQHRYRTYANLWRYRHPQPEDFFNAFDGGERRELAWFWRPWFSGTVTLDQAIERVEGVAGDSLAVTIVNRGGAMPVRLAIVRGEGTSYVSRGGGEVGATSNGRVTIRIAGGAGVRRLMLDPGGQLPDVDRRNNSWIR